MRIINCLVACLVALVALDARSQGHDFTALRANSGNPTSTATIEGFRDKVVELNNAMVSDDTARTQWRDAQRRSTDTGSSGSADTGSSSSGSGSKPTPAAKAGPKRFACTIYCKSSGGPTITRSFTAPSRRDAAAAAGDAADQLCQDAMQSRASARTLPERQCVEQ